MKDVIGNILDIENKANDIIEKGKVEKSLIVDKMNQDIEKMSRDIDLMVKAKLEQLDKQEKKDAEENLKRINEAAKKQLLEMEDFYKKNKEVWVNEVFNIVIGSEHSES